MLGCEKHRGDPALGCERCWNPITVPIDVVMEFDVPTEDRLAPAWLICEAQDAGISEKFVVEAIMYARRRGRAEGLSSVPVRITGRDGRFTVFVEEAKMFKGFFEYKFDKLDGGDEHLRAAIGGLYSTDEVWVSEMHDEPLGDGSDFHVLVYTPDDHRSHGGPKGKTSRMYSVAGGDRRLIVEWRWLRPNISAAGKILGFKPVL